MNITVLGHVCIDKNTSEHASYVSAGSPGMFMDKIFRQFPDTKTTIIAPYGKDFLPYQGSAVLIPRRPTSEKTLIYENITKNGVRQQKAMNRDSSLPLPLDDDIREILQNTDILFIAPLVPNYSVSYLKEIVTVINPQAIKVLLPQGYYRAFDESDHVMKRSFGEADDVLPLVDIVFVSHVDQDNMHNEITSWTQKHLNLIAVMTMSDKGALAIQNGKEIILPTIPVPDRDVVDSVGSGDIFSAGFSYRYRQTNDSEEAGRFANACARQCLFFTPDKITIDYTKLLK